MYMYNVYVVSTEMIGLEFYSHKHRPPKSRTWFSEYFTPAPHSHGSADSSI